MSKFQTGTSGNPRGRPHGSGKVAALRAQIEAHIPAIIATLVDAAKNGDMQAAKLLIDRCLPALKNVDLADPLNGKLTAAAVVGMLERGEISATAARALLEVSRSAESAADRAALSELLKP